MGFNSAFKRLISISGNMLIVQAGPVTILAENFRYFFRCPDANSSTSSMTSKQLFVGTRF